MTLQSGPSTGERSGVADRPDAWRHALRIARRWAKITSAVIGVPICGALLWLGILFLSGNIHVVEEGALYRSAQLTGSQLEQTITQYGIRTVINLRGSHPSEPWYDEELSKTQAAGAMHFDMALSARRELTEEELNRLTELLQNSPRPILVHCRSGADRTGLASALYELKIAGRPVDTAANQLSVRFGHIRYFNRTVAMDNTFARLVSNKDSD
jgi:uncharacterized protein (TIGR01244 family)